MHTIFNIIIHIIILFIYFCYRITEILGVYGEGEFSAKYAYPYIVAINNVSQFVSILFV